MLRLIPFELGRIWRRKSFILTVCTLLLTQLFLLWYTNLPSEDKPGLSAYKAIWNQLAGMDETQKGDYLAALKDTVDDMCFIRDICAMQSLQSEIGNALAMQEMQRRPGVLEANYETFQSGGYLQFTDSLEQEAELINELFAEQQTVAGYENYLNAIRTNGASLKGISIFGGHKRSIKTNSFSVRNLDKSAADYEHLQGRRIRFTPSKGITSAMEDASTDLLLFLALLLFLGSLMMEEKDKKLFLITRCTRYGRLQNICAKLSALCIHCIAVTALFYAVNLLFWGQCTGWWDLSADLQSLAPYRESCLPVSIGGYILLSILTKALVFFGVGALLTALCMLSDIAALPFLAAAALSGVSLLLYVTIPAGSAGAPLKYLNLAGLLRTENLYGAYLNFNLLGYPVSRLAMSLLLTALISAVGILSSISLFCAAPSLETRRLLPALRLPFHCHGNLLRHEGYKLLIANRALVFLLLFSALLAWRSLDRTYRPSFAEQYYRDIMLKLEGSLTTEKEELVQAERRRYDEAFARIQQIDEMVESGALSQDAAESLKAQEYTVTVFYPAFLRVETQYEQIKTRGGSFVYDTGYLYLLGVQEDAFSTDLLILSLGIILMTGGGLPMEYRTGSFYLLSATRAGRGRILRDKLLIYTAAAALLALVPIICRTLSIHAVYPLHHAEAALQNIPHYADFALPMPLCLFLLLFILSQAVTAALIALCTFALSAWCKKQAPTIVLSLLLLTAPLLLRLLGLTPACWFSLYPLYAWTGI